MINSKNIFNNNLEYECFILDIIEEYISYNKNKGKEVTQDKLIEWVEELSNTFEYLSEEYFDEDGKLKEDY